MTTQDMDLVHASILAFILTPLVSGNTIADVKARRI